MSLDFIRGVHGRGTKQKLKAKCEWPSEAELAQWNPVTGIPGMQDYPDDGQPKAKIVRMADVVAEEIAWLWKERFALGKLTLLAGDPGLGKSFLSLDLASRVTLGSPWPDGSGKAPQGGVVLISCEDGLADTIRPRLDAAGADVNRIVALEGVAVADKSGSYERAFDLTRDMPALEQALDAVEDCRLVVIDPISAFMGSTDSHKNADVRSTLAPLSDLAEQRRVAVLAVTHLRKGDGQAIYRAMGSLAFVAAARAAFCVVRDSDDPHRRLLLPIKNNIGGDTDGLAYTLTARHTGGVPCVEWEPDPVAVSADDAIAAQATRSKGKPGPEAEAMSHAEEWLSAALADGPRPTIDLADEWINGYGGSKRTLERAKQSLRVEAYRESVPGPWWCRLSKVANNTANTPDTEYLGDLGDVAKTPKKTHGFGTPKPKVAKIAKSGNVAPQFDFGGPDSPLQMAEVPGVGDAWEPPGDDVPDLDSINAMLASEVDDAP